jgi:hypothetical protein
MKFAIFIVMIHLNTKKKAFLREVFALVFYVQQQFMKLISESILTLCEREHEFAFFFRLQLA